tara:strand:+ start:3971 stop:4372 length:402 start_codon:yes stop_codon:yes gene_type:complete
MKQYLVLTNPSEAYAEALSSLIWGLCAHPTTTGTGKYCGHIVHPGPNDGPAPVALVLPVDDEVYVQPTADSSALVAAAHESIPDDEEVQLVADIEAARDSRVSVVALLPQSLQANLLTREEAEAAGWFVQTES